MLQLRYMKYLDSLLGLVLQLVVVFGLTVVVYRHDYLYTNVTNTIVVQSYYRNKATLHATFTCILCWGY